MSNKKPKKLVKKTTIWQKGVEKALTGGSTTGLVMQPKSTHGPVKSISIEDYNTSKNELQLNEFDAPITDVAGDVTPADSLGSILHDFNYYPSNMIRRLIDTRELATIERLWAQITKRIEFKEDAALVLSMLRRLKGIDTISIHPTQLLDNPLLSDFTLKSAKSEKLDDSANRYVAVVDIETDRPHKLVQITAREGQQEFRKKLITHYACLCMVSGEAIDSVIEAAHITPYDGLKTNTLDNGLLLRVDIHRLFDKGLIVINPSSLYVHVSKHLNGSSYTQFDGKKLTFRQSHKINVNLLQPRWLAFKSNENL